MKWKLAAVLAAAPLGAVPPALASEEPIARQVGAATFAIPQPYLFEDTIPWLPAQAHGFTFRLALDRPFNREHRVLVQSSRTVCLHNPPSQMMRVACGLERAHMPAVPSFRKVFPHPEYRVSWRYVIDTGHRHGVTSPETLEVASCISETNRARPESTAICQSHWGFEGLVLSLYFEERELNELPALRARAAELLQAWKVR